jgi:hypothetical protein
MKNKIYTIITSLFFLVCSAVGQYLGVVSGELLSWIYGDIMHLNMGFMWFDSVLPGVVSGLMGGWLSALVCSKIYSSYHFGFILIIPTLVMIISSLGFLLYLDSVGVSFETVMPIVTNIVTLYAFFMFLRGTYPSRRFAE